MRITSIQITNLAAFKEFTVKLPAVGILEGTHGVGKSSIERILCYAFGLRPLAEKGQKSILHDPSILHGTADKGEALINFDDGPLESLRVRVSADKTERTIKVRGKKAWELAGQQIYDITNALAYNPMAFRDLEPKERLEAFLKVVPVEISREEISAASGRPLIEIPEKPGLDTINDIFDYIYKERTACNTSADTQAKHAGVLEAALGPAAPDGDWGAELKRLRDDKATLETSEQQEIARIGRELAAKKDGVAGERRTSDAVIDESTDLAIKKLEQEIETLRANIATLNINRAERKSLVASEESEAVTALRNAANSEVSELRTANAPLHQKLTTDIATAEERARNAAMAEGTRKAVETARKEADSYRARSKSMTDALDRLKELKTAVAGRMKIRGVTIASPREGLPVDICREEAGALVPFPSWNSADMDQFCLKIAMLYRGTCGLVMVDSMGNWNEERRAAIIGTCRKYAEAENMQFLLGDATTGELTVRDVTEAIS